MGAWSSLPERTSLAERASAEDSSATRLFGRNGLVSRVRWSKLVDKVLPRPGPHTGCDGLGRNRTSGGLMHEVQVDRRPAWAFLTKGLGQPLDRRGVRGRNCAGRLALDERDRAAAAGHEKVHFQSLL